MAYTNVWTTAAPLDTQAANQGAVDFRATKLDVMQRIASFGAGLLAARPTPEATSASANWTGVMYWATDTNQAFRWNGASWDDISTNLPTSVADFLATSGASVNVVAAAPPSTGQILRATNATHATWQDIPAATDLATSGASVNVSAAAPPTAGQVLEATDATHATWQSPIVSSTTQKSGSGGGAYTIGGAQADIDGTNLKFTIVIPVGYKLIIDAIGTVSTSAAGSCKLFLVDGVTDLNAIEMGGVTSFYGFAMRYVLTGDGASHTIALQGIIVAGGANVQNTAPIVPIMTFQLLPSS